MPRLAIMRLLLLSACVCLLCSGFLSAQEPPFGESFSNLERFSTGEWWKVNEAAQKDTPKKRNPKKIINMQVPRDEVVAFAVYTQDAGILKLSTQLFPLLPDEPREVTLEFLRGDEWKKAATEKVIELGWSAHFRINDWDASRSVAYRVRHGEKASFEGTIRRDPIEKETVVVANLSCNSSRTAGPRPIILDNLLAHDPDLVFFAGDQTYHHTEHTAGWLQFGLQFRELLKDRPTVTIPDDHDVGQANLWGESGKRATNPAGPSGGYFYPAKYVNMVQRQQTWHLPDAWDSQPIDRDISVYFTRLRVGGIDFAILEDRKFKSGPEGKIPKMGPRPDHINDPKYDRSAVDLEGLVLLGERQLKFLNEWGQDWTDANLKAVLSQTAFCGAVHIHGSPTNRLLADLDSNAWPQTGRRKALREIRRAWAPHLCGDQHLAVVVQHGIDQHGDGPFGFTSPALVNTIYGRWWHPEDEKAGPNPVPESPLPWTGDFEDGLGNAISMIAYANPENRADEKRRSDGYGIARFNKTERTVTFECWPRFSQMQDGESAQFPGWPVTVRMADNDGRKAVATLPPVKKADPVIQVIEEATGEILYTQRVPAGFEPPVYAKVKYTVKWGRNKPDEVLLSGYELT
ncbi:MAG: metallophosphoesterase family protein [Verrucomicrobiota bacterium]